MRRRLLSNRGLDISNLGYVWIATNFMTGNSDADNYNNIGYELWDIENKEKVESGKLNHIPSDGYHHPLNTSITLEQFRIPDDILNKHKKKLDNLCIRVVKYGELINDKSLSNSDFYIMTTPEAISNSTTNIQYPVWSYLTLHSDDSLVPAYTQYYEDDWGRYPVKIGNSIVYPDEFGYDPRQPIAGIDIKSPSIKLTTKGLFSQYQYDTPFQPHVYAQIIEADEIIIDDSMSPVYGYDYLFDIDSSTYASEGFLKVFRLNSIYTNFFPTEYITVIKFFIAYDLNSDLDIYPWISSKEDYLMEIENNLHSAQLISRSAALTIPTDIKENHNEVLSNKKSYMKGIILPYNIENDLGFQMYKSVIVEFIDAKGRSLGAFDGDTHKGNGWELEIDKNYQDWILSVFSPLVGSNFKRVDINNQIIDVIKSTISIWLSTPNDYLIKKEYDGDLLNCLKLRINYALSDEYKDMYIDTRVLMNMVDDSQNSQNIAAYDSNENLFYYDNNQTGRLNLYLDEPVDGDEYQKIKVYFYNGVTKYWLAVDGISVFSSMIPTSELYIPINLMNNLLDNKSFENDCKLYLYINYPFKMYESEILYRDDVQYCVDNNCSLNLSMIRTDKYPALPMNNNNWM